MATWRHTDGPGRSAFRWLWAGNAAGNLADGVAFVAIPLVVPVGGVDPTGYGVILAGSSLGGVLASLVTAPLRAVLGYRVLVPASLALGSVAMAGLALTRSPVVAAGLLAGYIFHVTTWNVCAVSLRQRLVPEHLRGRLNSLVKLSGLIGLVLGAAVAGPLADATGLSTPYAVAGAIFAGLVVYTAVLLKAEPTVPAG